MKAKSPINKLFHFSLLIKIRINIEIPVKWNVAHSSNSHPVFNYNFPSLNFERNYGNLNVLLSGRPQ